MSATYDKIIKCLNKTRRDYLFPPSDLNKLDNDERKNVEERIIKLCLLGDRACFQYIDYLVMFKPKDVFNDDTLKDVSVTKRAFIYKRLYYLTKDYSYIVELYELAKKDINAYSILTRVVSPKILKNSANLYSNSSFFISFFTLFTTSS